MGSSASEEQKPCQEIVTNEKGNKVEDPLTQNQTESPNPIIEKKTLEIGDEISRPLDSIVGKLFPATFRHTGIYVGENSVISKYIVIDKRDTNSSELSGPAIIKLENINSKGWEGWTVTRKGSLASRDKAFIYYQGFVSGHKENYHIKTDNCQHFTEYCLAGGIGSRVN